MKIAVIGSGISGLSAAWLLSQAHDVVIYERNDRVGGHSHTVLADIAGRYVPVDIGFIVFNRQTYPNLSALFARLGVPTRQSNMSFAVSMADQSLEYSLSGFADVLGQPHNLLRRRFWSMIADLLRFYRHAPVDAELAIDHRMSLGQYLDRRQYGAAFRDDHLLPMASAIWSSAPDDMLDYPAAAFIRFHCNHGLLRLRGRPAWETVAGGSRRYVERLMAEFKGRVLLDTPVRDVRRTPDEVIVTDAHGHVESFDHVVLACHANQALSVLADVSPKEQRLLGAFRYSRNLAVLHTDDSFMPKRRAVWASWNYLGTGSAARKGACVTYWMNRLQSLETDIPVFVTLNPPAPPRPGTLLHSEVFEHPIFDASAMAAQQQIWNLQGVRNTWFCGAYFGAGFHEDGLQAGLAVAEQLGGLRRPWHVDAESSRIRLDATAATVAARGMQVSE